MKYFEIALLMFLIVCSISVFLTRKTFTAIIIFSTFSLVMSIIWIVLKAPDLAIVEAAVDAGITGLLIFIVLGNVNEMHEGTFNDMEKILRAKKAANFFSNNSQLSSVDEEYKSKKERSKSSYHERTNKLYIGLSIICAVSIISLLLFTVDGLPTFGDPNNPTMNEVSRRYIEKGVEETGAINTVAGLILDYRAFDTFGEAVMLFTSAIAVIALIRRPIKEGKYEDTSK